MGLFNLPEARRATDASGTPVPKAIRKLYPMGSVSSARVFRDRDLTDEIPTEMVADGQGWFDLCYVVDGMYRVEIRDPRSPYDPPLFSAENVAVGPESDIDLWRSFPTLAALEADRQLGYEADGGFGIRVQPDDIVYLSGNDMQLRVMPADFAGAHVVSAGGVRFCETGVRYSGEARLADAVARGDSFIADSTVIAGGSLYVFHDDGRTTLPGLPGWGRVLTPQTGEDLSEVKAKTDLITVGAPVDLDLLPTVIAASQTYASVADGLAGTGDGAVFFVQSGPGTRVFRNDAGVETFLGWRGDIVFDDVAELLASDIDLPAGAKIRTRAQGFTYEVAATEATDHHLTTAGGAKLYVLPLAQGGLPVAAFGPAMDGITDDTDAVQAAFDAVEDGGVLVFPDSKTILLYGVRLLGKGAKIKLNGCTLLKRPATSADSDNMEAWTGDSFWWTSLNYAPFIYCNAGELHVEGPGTLDGQRDVDTYGAGNHSGGFEKTINRAGIVASNWAPDGATVSKLVVRDVDFVDFYGLPVQSFKVPDLTLERLTERNSAFFFTRSSGPTNANNEPLPGTRVIVRDCQFHGTREYGNVGNCFTLNLFDTCIFERNIVDGRDKVLPLYSLNGTDSPKFQGHNHIVADGNTFYASGMKQGSGSGTTPAQSIIITNNYFSMPNGLHHGSGIYTLDDAVYAEVRNNTFENCIMRALSTSSTMIVDGNTVRMTEQYRSYLNAGENTGSTHELRPIEGANMAHVGGSGRIQFTNNLIDGGGFGYHIGLWLYIVQPSAELEIRGNTFIGVDNAIAEAANADSGRWHITDNRFLDCRTVGEFRLPNAGLLCIENNYFGTLDTEAPQATADGTNWRGLELRVNGPTSVWDKFIFRGNLIDDDSNMWQLNFGRSSDGVTIGHFNVSNNTFLSGGASPIDGVTRNSGADVINVTDFVFCDNVLVGNADFSSGWSITNLHEENNRFVSGGITGLSRGRTVADLPSNPTAGQRAFVTDATSPTLGAGVTGGGSGTVPVFYDGNQWRVG